MGLTLLPPLPDSSCDRPSEPGDPHSLPPKPSRPFRALGWIFGIGIFFTLTALGAVYAALENAIQHLNPIPYLENYRPPIPSRILDSNAQVIGEIFVDTQNRAEVVTLDRIPRNLILALLATEDVQFYKHPGVDAIGILRAAYKDIKTRSIREGASTVTMLLAKDLYEIGEYGDIDTRLRSWEQKINEALLALKIERNFTKDEILELFFNQIELGGNIIGVGTAAQHYFGKDVSDLNLKECALFVRMLKAPTRFNPLNNPDRAQAGTEVVLRRMLECGFITQDEYETARDEPFQLKTKSARRPQISKHPYVNEYLRTAFQLYKEYHGSNGMPIFLEGTGYDVHTTIDDRLQTVAEEALRKGLIAHEQHRRFERGSHWGMEGNQGPNSHTRGVIEPNRIFDAKIISSSTSTVTINDATSTVWHVDVFLPSVKNGEGPFRIDIPADESWMDEFGVLDSKYYLTVQLAEDATPEKPRFVLDNSNAKITDAADFAVINDNRNYVQGALIAVQPSTGKILAMVGGYNFYDMNNAGNVNRVFTLHKQPGSAFKPLLYAAAVSEAGFTPASIMSDRERTYHPGTLWEWTPKNYDDKPAHGEVAMEYALAESMNMASVHLLDTFMGSRVKGWNTLRKFCKDNLGLVIDEQPNLTWALGTMSVNPYDLARAYSVFASGGWLRDLYVVESVKERVIDEHQIPKEIYLHAQDRYRPLPRRTMDDRDAAMVTSMLRSVATYGTARELGAEFEVPLVGKTGTTNDCMAAWFAGYGKDLVCVVYVGYDTMRTLGYKMTGSKVALPIWKEFMHAAIEAHPESFGEFELPKGVTEIKINHLTGQIVSEYDSSEHVKTIVCRNDRLPGMHKGVDARDILTDLDRTIFQPISAAPEPLSDLPAMPPVAPESPSEPQWKELEDPSKATDSSSNTPPPTVIPYDPRSLEFQSLSPDLSTPGTTTEPGAHDPAYVPDAAQRDLQKIMSEPEPTLTPETPGKSEEKPRTRWWRKGRRNIRD